jgi:cellulose synthase/poly-beta-1,6-N-acetylglucosamine synthase-like glycosyltransferase
VAPLDIAFWTALGLVGYVYGGYPAIVCLLSRLSPRPIRRGPATPTITIVITAHNEERHIAAKIENCLALAYPADRLNLAVVSDGSTDRTAAVVGNYASRFPGRIALITLPRRRGKATALNVGVARASGDIVLFADARQQFDPEVATALIQNFADPAVGAVSGELILRSPGGNGQGEGLGLYWRYEKEIRKAESGWGSSMGYTGAVSAIRRSLFEPLAEETLLDDLVTPLRVIARQYRVVFEPRARAYDTVSAAPGQEFGRKVRTLAGVLQTCLNVRTLIGPLPARVWWQLLSHKLLRLFVPYLLMIALVVNAFLVGPVYRTTLLVQVLLYALGLAGLLLSGRLGRSWAVALPATFLLLNSAAVVAAFRYAAGSRLDLWRAPAQATTEEPILLGGTYATGGDAKQRAREQMR